MHLAGIIVNLEEPPILIGHSMGGLVVQLLLQKDLAAAGVAIDSAPPAGVFTAKWSFLKSNWPMISPFVSRYTPREMSLADFQYAFVNNLPLAEQQAAYERYVVPESRLVPQESLGSTAKIDFERAHVPLLLTAGSADHILPASPIYEIIFTQSLRTQRMNSGAPVILWSAVASHRFHNAGLPAHSKGRTPYDLPFFSRSRQERKGNPARSSRLCVFA